MNKQVKNIMSLVAWGYFGYIIGVVVCSYFIHKETMDIFTKLLINIIDNFTHQLLKLFDNKILNICDKVSNLVCGIAAVGALLFSIIQHKYTVNNERRNKTLSRINEIQKNYINWTIPGNEVQTQIYINELEFLGMGINKKIYDIDAVYVSFGHFLTEQYYLWARAFIEYKRKDIGDETVGINYESMIFQLQEIQEKKQLLRQE